MNYIKKIKNILVVLLGLNSYLYGNIGIVRLYARFPRILPLNARIQHGWYVNTSSNKDDLNSDRPLMLVWSKRIAELWKEKSVKPVEILGAPFVLYRRIKNITIKAEACGTVVFPHHSTKSHEIEYEIDEYCRTLHDLPVEYKPVTVCLYYMDFDSQSPIFKKHGFNVVTVGKPRWWGFRFVKRFYDILSKHRYCTSNAIGSYTFYSVEMGIPFFLSGSGSVIKLRPGQKKFDPNTIFPNEVFLENLILLFSEIRTTISDEQRKIVLDEVGVNDAISPERLRHLFFKNISISKIIGKVDKIKDEI